MNDKLMEATYVLVCLVLLAGFTYFAVKVGHYEKYIDQTPAELQALSKSCESKDCKLKVVVVDKHRRTIKPLCSSKK